MVPQAQPKQDPGRRLVFEKTIIRLPYVQIAVAVLPFSNVISY